MLIFAGRSNARVEGVAGPVLAWETLEPIPPGTELICEYKQDERRRAPAPQSQSEALAEVHEFLRRAYKDEADAFLAASKDRVTTNVCVPDSTGMCVTERGVGGIAYDAPNAVAWKKNNLLSFEGAVFDGLPDDGVDAMRRLHGAGLGTVTVEDETASLDPRRSASTSSPAAEEGPFIAPPRRSSRSGRQGLHRQQLGDPNAARHDPRS